MKDKETTKWYDSHENLELVVRYSIKIADYTAGEILSLLEKPWHYNRDFELAQEEFREQCYPSPIEIDENGNVIENLELATEKK